MSPPRFKPGLALGRDDLYVEREADGRLFALLSQGTWCHVLAPRQVGKSSLRIRVAARLRKAGVRASAVELSAIHVVGESAVEQQEAWYKALARRIAQPLGLDAAVLETWQVGASGTPAEQFRLVLRDVIAAPGPLVLFLDEVDRTLSLPISIDRDDFFGLLREIANGRADDPVFQQLTVCFLGVALLSDLSRDPQRTPFTLVEGIELADFSRPQLNHFAPAIGELGLEGDTAAWLDEIFRWTRGHPAMVQRIGFELARERPSDDAPAAVAAAVERTYLRTGLQEDAVLVDTSRRFLQRHEELLGGHATQMLSLTKRLRRGEEVEFQPQKAAHQALRIAGMAVVCGRRFELRNEIFRLVFDESWVQEREGERLLREAVARWRRTEQVLQGPDLDAALRWEAEQGEINEDERQLIRASLAERERRHREERAEQERRFTAERAQLARRLEAERVELERLRRYQRRRGVIRAVAITGALVATIFGFYSWGVIREILEEEKARSRRELLAFREEWFDEHRHSHVMPGLEETKVVEAISKVGQVRQLGGRTTTSAEVVVNSTVDSLRVRTLSRRLGPAVSAVMLDDGERVLSVSADGALRVWDVTSERELSVTWGPSRKVSRAAFSRDGKTVVTVDDDGAARVWLAVSGHEIVTMGGDHGRIKNAAFSPDGGRVVTADEDGTTRVRNAASGRELVALQGHSKAVLSAAFSLDGSRVVTASEDGTARVWDATSGHPLIAPLKHEGPVLSAAFSPDGTRVATAGKDGTAHVWDVTSKRAPVPVTTRYHSEAVLSIAFSPDGRRVVTAGEDSKTCVWDRATGRLLDVLPYLWGQVRSAVFSPDGERVVTAGGNEGKYEGDDGAVHVWGMTSERELAVLRGHGRQVWGAAFLPDGERVVTAGWDGTVRVWDELSIDGRIILRGHAGTVYRVAVSSDGDRIVTASEDGTARVWDAASGHAPVVLLGHNGRVFGAALSPDGGRVVTAGKDGTAHVWDAASAWAFLSLLGHSKAVLSAAFSPDGSRVVTAGEDGTARVWDTASGHPLIAPLRHEGSIASASFSPDGERVVTAGRDGTVRVWDAASGHNLSILVDHLVPRSPVWSAAFSPDGERVVAAHEDGTARVWHVAEELLLVVLRGHADQVVNAAFSPDGERVVTASLDGTARIWDISLEHTIARGCAVLRKTSHWVERSSLREACQSHLTAEGRPLLK